MELVNKIGELSKKKGVKLSQFVLAWVLAQGTDFIVIPGTKRIKYLEENFAAGDIKLTPEEISQMRGVVDEVSVCGDRYPPTSMRFVSQ